MSIDQPQDLIQLQEIGRIVAECLQHMASSVQPGMTTRELDEIGRRFLSEQGAQSAPELVYRFPGATCISVNEEVAHGIPGNRVIRAGDLVNIDVSAEKNGFFADTGGSFAVPPVRPEVERLCAATRQALEAAIDVARAGQPLNVIGKAIEEIARSSGYTVIRNLGSHGVGRALHEAPKFIPGFFDARDTRVLQENMVITIEPFLSTGVSWVKEPEDGWTLKADPGILSAQYEHTLVITRDRPLILT